MSLPIFSYQRHCPLPSASTHLRLLELNPSPEFSDALSCTLQVCPVTEAPPYEALSYTCGSDDKTSILFIQHQGYISVTASLNACLRYLRHQSEKRSLWIDQICINQADSVEKGCQVRLMSKIYSLALRVLAWDADLGIIPDYSEASTVARVYTRATRAIANSGSIEFLSLCRLSRDKASDGLPSWVPDWRAALQPSFCHADNGDIEARLFAAGGPDGTRPVVLHTSDENILGVQGCLVGEVESLGEPWYGLDQTTPDSEMNLDENGSSVAGNKTRPYQAAQTFLVDVKRLCLQAATKHTKPKLSAVAEDTKDRLMEAEWRVPCGDIVKSTTPGGGKLRATEETRDAYTAAARFINLQACREGLQADELPLDSNNIQANVDNLRARADNFRAILDSLGILTIAQANLDSL